MTDPGLDALTSVFRILDESLRARTALNCLEGFDALNSVPGKASKADEERGFTRNPNRLKKNGKAHNGSDLGWFGHVAAAHGPRREELLLVHCEEHRKARGGTRHIRRESSF
jgi:hypothetical protein